jgi:hypothetical protein
VVIYTQARGRASNSAASFPADGQNSAARKLAEIAGKLLISRWFSALRGYFLAPPKRFSLPAWEMSTFPDSRPYPQIRQKSPIGVLKLFNPMIVDGFERARHEVQNRLDPLCSQRGSLSTGPSR